jgi:hypothetical protein
MRLGLDLRPEAFWTARRPTDGQATDSQATDGPQPVSAAVDQARQADNLGLWAVVIGGRPGTEAVRAGEVIDATSNLAVIVDIDLDHEHPFTVAEELSVLDNLSAGRVGAILSGTSPERAEQVRAALQGHVISGAMLAPPPVQTSMTTWLDTHVARRPENVARQMPWASPGQADLGTDLATAQVLIDGWRNASCTHLMAKWGGSVTLLARHLATRAATVDFPSIVATMADDLFPLDD